MPFQSKADFRRELEERDYRHVQLASHVKTNVAFQIRSLRDDMSQKELAGLMGKNAKSAVSRMEQPHYGAMSMTTLLDLCRALDVAIQIEFIPFSEFCRKVYGPSPNRFSIPNYESMQEKERLDEWAGGSDSRINSEEKVFLAGGPICPVVHTDTTELEEGGDEIQAMVGGTIGGNTG